MRLDNAIAMSSTGGTAARIAIRFQGRILETEFDFFEKKMIFHPSRKFYGGTKDKASLIQLYQNRNNQKCDSSVI